MNTIILKDGTKEHTLPNWIGIQAKGEPMTKTKWRRTDIEYHNICLLYTSPSPRDGLLSRMPSSA